MKIFTWVAVFSCAWLTAFSGALAVDREELIRKARAEGEVVFYTSIGIDLSRPIAAAFENKYPFLSVKIHKGNAESLFNKVVVEHLAGRVQADVVALGTTPLFKHRGLLAEYTSEEAGAYPKKFRDPDGTWVGFAGIYYVLGYNTRLVPRENAPKDWSDLLDPKWRGKIGMDPEEGRWYGALVEYLGNKTTTEFMQGLSRQDIQWRKGHSLLAQLVTAGEVSFALVYAHRSQALKELGAPLEWVKSTRPIVVAPNGIAVLKDAPHSAGARLFVDFFLSMEAQKGLLDVGHIPLRGDIIPENSPFYPHRLALHPVSGDVMIRLKENQEKFEELIGQ